MPVYATGIHASTRVLRQHLPHYMYKQHEWYARKYLPVLQWVAVCRCVLRCVAVCCSVLLCVAVYTSNTSDTLDNTSHLFVYTTQPSFIYVTHVWSQHLLRHMIHTTRVARHKSRHAYPCTKHNPHSYTWHMYEVIIWRSICVACIYNAANVDVSHVLLIWRRLLVRTWMSVIIYIYVYIYIYVHRSYTSRLCVSGVCKDV
jgi:hypothetical protein